MKTTRRKSVYECAYCGRVEDERQCGGCGAHKPYIPPLMNVAGDPYYAQIAWANQQNAIGRQNNWLHAIGGSANALIDPCLL